MTVENQKLFRLFVAGTFFWMVFLLTPRVWVDQVQYTSDSEVPVNALDEPDRCLFCEPETTPQPVNCEETDSREGEKLWLNPDEPLPENEAPCLDKEEDDESPSA